MSDGIPVRDGRLDLGPAVPLWLDAAGARIAALQAGDSDVSVLMVPGYTGSKEDFGPLFAPLAAAGLRPVAIDLPGQYESPDPGSAEGFATNSLGATVLAAAAALGGRRVHLVGHSFGGLVARAAVLANPFAFGSLVLMDSGPAEIGGNRRALIDHLGPLLDEVGVAGVYDTTVALAEAEPGYAAPHPVLAEFLHRRFVAGSPARLRGMGDALRNEPDRVAELAATALPKLVLYGAGDDAWPPAVQAEMAARLGARCVVIAGAAHSPAVENPAATAKALLDFLQSVPE